ncbi:MULTISPECIES: hypothetical protein [unclassified Haloferax]|uniref:hypothetical protein n=1 Tax=Haloferax TaxID=2251 RepID=UPI0002B22DEA|nr:MULTISPECIES: hypothetical protein [unclassified Haloferax]ELZ59226.1 hypothetical protein C460_07785 [Haloferax sp. ATCC BAA-646]ELZ60032.1 hypothetical protein C459_17911 [Haloferax sp. ATCC BAA-645]
MPDESVREVEKLMTEDGGATAAELTDRQRRFRSVATSNAAATATASTQSATDGDRENRPAMPGNVATARSETA